MANEFRRIALAQGLLPCEVPKGAIVPPGGLPGAGRRFAEGNAPAAATGTGPIVASPAEDEYEDCPETPPAVTH